MGKKLSAGLFGLALAMLLAAPAASQMLWDEPPWEGEDLTTDVNEGRFVALGGIFGGQRIDCVRCHELDGSGNSSGAFPRLSDQSAWYLYKTLHDYATGRRPSAIMEPIARSLTSEQMRDVAGYYASIKDAPYHADPAADAETLQIGGAISAVGIPEQGVPACTGCHGADGVGNVPVVPYLAGQFAPYLERQLLLWKNGERGGDPMNVMEMIARNMTEDQIRAVSLYFANLQPREVTPNDLRLQAQSPGQAPAAEAGAGPDMGAVQQPVPGAGQTVVPGAEVPPPEADASRPAEPPMEPAAESEPLEPAQPVIVQPPDPVRTEQVPADQAPYLAPPGGGDPLETTTTTRGVIPDAESSPVQDAPAAGQ